MSSYSTNEWDPLKKVIVGSATGARIPEMDISLRTVNYADVEDISKIKTGYYPQTIIDEANEDLEIFCDFLRGEGVEVLRPEEKYPTEYYDYCPRDLMFIHGDTAIATPVPLRSRHLGYLNLMTHFSKAILPIRYTHDDLYNEACIGDPHKLALHEISPSFDAANIIRANEDILYLVSNSGNVTGAQYLQKKLGTSTTVHLLQGVYSYMHIDSTIAFLREGLMLINPDRIKDINVLPKPFRNWDYIVCPEPTDIGYYGDYCNASKWINMNLFSINTNLVVLEEHQNSLRRELEKHKIECAMLPMRHQRSLGGGFHCVTLDLERCGS